MTGVIIRCQNCGTTQVALGECDACHEGDARYYCPNHTPGRWLDEPSCNACGARVGLSPVVKRAPARTAPSPPPAAPPMRPSRVERPPIAPRWPAPRADRDVEGEVSEAPWPPPVRAPRRVELEILDMLRRAVTEGRSVRRGGVPISPRKSFSVFGCLFKLAMLLLLLFVLGVMAFYALFGVGGILYGDSGSLEMFSVQLLC